MYSPMQFVVAVFALLLFGSSEAKTAPQTSGMAASHGAASVPSSAPYWPYSRCMHPQSVLLLGEAAKLQIANSFNNMLSTHQIGAKYQFNNRENYIVEGANRLLAAGATTLKISLTRKECGVPGINASTPFTSFLAFVTDPRLPWLRVFDMPFSTFMFWTDKAWQDPKDPSKLLDVYKQIYDVATYLLTRYNGTGKTFMFGEWKGDTQLWPGTPLKFPNLSQPFNPAKQQFLIDQHSEQQRAIDDAKRDLSGKVRDVSAWFYPEVNMLPDGEHPVFLTHVLPYIKPPVDYLSFSLSTSPELCNSLPHMANRLSSLLSTANSFLAPKPGVPGVRVFIGEFEYPLFEEDGRPYQPTTTEALQARYALWQAACAIAWGSPYNMWWTLYDNTITNTTKPKPRAFHLVTPENKDTVLYQAFQEYWRTAHAYVSGWVDATGQAPGDLAFRRWAVNKLVELSNVTDLPKPTVRDQGC